jgi:hypothetical protein
VSNFGCENSTGWKEIPTKWKKFFMVGWYLSESQAISLRSISKYQCKLLKHQLKDSDSKEKIFYVQLPVIENPDELVTRMNKIISGIIILLL